MTSRLPASLRGRLLLAFGLLSITGIILAAAVTYRESQRAEDRDIQRDLSAEAVTLARLAGDGLAGSDPESFVASIAAASGKSAAIADARGNVIASAGDQAIDEDDLTAAVASLVEGGDESPSSIAFSSRAGQSGALAVIQRDPTQVLLLVSPEEDDVVGSSDFWWRTLTALLVVASVAVIAGYLTVRKATTPLDQLRAHAAGAARSERDVHIPTPGPVEVRDIAEAVNALSARLGVVIRESENARQRLESIFENLHEGVVVVDTDETVVAENVQARILLGGEKGIGRPFVLVARDHDLTAHLRDAMRQQDVLTTSVEYARSGLVFEVTAIPVDGPNERLGIVVIRDISDLRRLESVRREFVANVSHELRTPLASIRALADTLQAGAVDDPDVSYEFVGRIVSEVDRLTMLVDELLDLGRLESGRLSLRIESIPATVLITGGADRLRPQVQRAGLELRIDMPDSLPDVSVDRSRIEQVMVNLIHNAIKFTEPGGIITLGAKADGAWIQVDVTDTGSGIPETELPRIFERFFKADRSRQSEGTGLGLAISKHIVLAHGGEIWATSTVGQGSTFSFRLPRSAPGGAQRERSNLHVRSGDRDSKLTQVNSLESGNIVR